jgi:hypothetical protein
MEQSLHEVAVEQAIILDELFELFGIEEDDINSAI